MNATNRSVERKLDEREEVVWFDAYWQLTRGFTITEFRVFIWLLQLGNSDEPWEDGQQAIIEKLNIGKAQTFQTAMKTMERMRIAKTERVRKAAGHFDVKRYWLRPFDEWDAGAMMELVKGDKR